MDFMERNAVLQNAEITAERSVRIPAFAGMTTLCGL